MCAAWSRAGAEVTLITKGSARRQEAGVTDDFAFYGLDPAFEIVKLPRPAFRGGGLVFETAIKLFLRRRRNEIDLVYARDVGGARAAVRLGLPLIFEAHGLPAAREVPRFSRIVRHPGLVRIVVISAALRKELLEQGLVPDGVEILVAPDAADPFEGTSEPSAIPEERRQRYGYIGQLYPGKAMELLIPLAGAMPDADFDVIGGSEEDLSAWRNAALPPNLKLHGFAPHGELAPWYARFDALLLPSQREVYGASRQRSIADVMSPMKLFEYMAVGKPIVSSDLPVLREILRHEENALLVDPDDAGAWRQALERLTTEKDLARRLAATAQSDFLANYTWDKRAARVLGWT